VPVDKDDDIGGVEEGVAGGAGAGIGAAEVPMLSPPHGGMETTNDDPNTDRSGDKGSDGKSRTEMGGNEDGSEHVIGDIGPTIAVEPEEGYEVHTITDPKDDVILSVCEGHVGLQRTVPEKSGRDRGSVEGSSGGSLQVEVGKADFNGGAEILVDEDPDDDDDIRTKKKTEGFVY